MAAATTAIFLLITVATVTLIVWVQEGQRRTRAIRQARAHDARQPHDDGGRAGTYVPLRIQHRGHDPADLCAESPVILPSTLASYFIRGRKPIGLHPSLSGYRPP